MNIPAAEKLQLQEEGAGVRIPLQHNLNDKGCLFAGSIFAGAILAAYRAAERLFASPGLAGDLVAKTSTANYLKRINSDGLACATVCGEPVCKPNGNRTLDVTVSVRDAEGSHCAELSVTFVLMRQRGESSY